jgi:hypothetical protein
VKFLAPQSVNFQEHVYNHSDSTTNAASGQSAVAGAAAAAAASSQARRNRNTMLVAGHAVEQACSDMVTSISTTNQAITAKV